VADETVLNKVFKNPTLGPKLAEIGEGLIPLAQ
jgi:hypothetical protein